MRKKSKKVDMNEIARIVTKLEGGKRVLNISDVKEALRCLKGVCQDHKVLIVTMKYLLS